MASFPELFSGSAALDPVTRFARRATRVLEFTDFTEQRFRVGAGLQAFVLQLDGISRADMLSLRSFFDARKGSFDATWDIDLGGTVYANMQFSTDTFEARERAGGYYIVELPCRQVKA